MYCRVIILGRIASGLEVRQLPTGVPVLDFRIAVKRPYLKKNEENLTEERPTDFFTCVAWRKRAEFVAKYFKKGNVILIDGRLENREFVDKNNVQRLVTEIIIETVSFTGEPRPKIANGTLQTENIVDDEELPF